VQHFRQLGVRTPAFLILEPYKERDRAVLESEILRIDPATDPTKVLLIEPVDPHCVENLEIPVAPLPQRLTSWLEKLPKPAGVFCLQAGGGGYLIRVCREMGLRVPEDVAIIATDDADVCLMTEPTLTSILPSGEQVGLEAMKVLIRMMAGAPAPKTGVLVDATEIHIRQSTGRKIEICNVGAAVEYINRRACEGIRVDDVLRETQNVSRMTFYREFRKATGRLPGDAIRERQIEEACRLLRSTELSITLVARMCGFSDNSSFARAFRASHGCAPMKFRRRRGGRGQT
jgi:LacI family transcriptional regulator